MKYCFSFIPATLVAMVLLAACGKEDEHVTPEDTYTDVPYLGGEGGVQPMTGIVFWNDSDYLETDAIQLEYAYVRYSDICSQKDSYIWDAVERILAGAASRKHQAIVRFYYTYPGKKSAVPDYIKALPDYKETVGKSEGLRTWFPDWRCGELQRFHKEFYRLFAERYDSDPRLAFLETGFGLWAEYHIYDGPFIAGQTFPSEAFQAEWLQAMDGWFRQTPWCISIDAAQYGPFEKKPALLAGGFGNFDDSFMCEEHDRYNAEDWLFFGKDRYLRAPLGGEFSYYTDYDQEHCLDAAGIYGRSFESEAARFHLTFIIGNDQPDYQPMSRIRSASTATGYRFQLVRFAVKEGDSAVLTIKNIGVAPIYQDAFPTVDGVRGEFNLRTLMPGDTATVTIATPTASAASVPGVICDRLVQGQHIDLVSH
ncbi:MAG: DUF4832 domain-containing protein [Bacteroidales bacterium]|nr:DUF4832 domain-containing protein [Bacteroidales bacterium]